MPKQKEKATGGIQVLPHGKLYLREAQRFGDYCMANRSLTVPPDLDEMNDQRAKWGEQALGAFVLASGAEPEDALCDLLCDLIHFCDRVADADGADAFNFEKALSRARSHYYTETGCYSSSEENRKADGGK